MWFINRRSFLLSVFCLGDCKRPQLIFPHSVFRKMQSFKERKSSWQLGNFQTWKKASPVASSVLSGAFSSGICNIKSSDIGKWTICKQFAANLSIQEMKQLCAVFSLHFSWRCSGFFGYSQNFLVWSQKFFVLKLGTFLKLLPVRASELRSWFLSWCSDSDSQAQSTWNTFWTVARA